MFSYSKIKRWAALTLFCLYYFSQANFLFLFFKIRFPVDKAKNLLAMKELFKVLKDHNDKSMQDLVTSSYQQCFVTVAEGFFERF